MIREKVKTKNIPAELKKRKQWVAWKSVPDKNGGKASKIPIDPKTGNCASTTDPATWGTFGQALAFYRKNSLSGVGFVFTKDDDLAGTDLDNCLNPETDEIEEWAENIIEDVKSYSEISPSGKGVKIFVKARLPEGKHRIGGLPSFGGTDGGIEFYDDKRFFTVTGHKLKGSSKKILSKPKTIKRIYGQYIDKNEKNQVEPFEAPASCRLSDKQIIKKASSAKNGKKFKDLFDGDISGYNSRSEAELALCTILAFWVARDPARIDRLFRLSGLKRDKWDKIHDPDGKRTYGQMTIDKAIASCRATYKSGTTHDIEREVEDLIESFKANPKGAVKDILKNKDALKIVTVLYRYERSQFEAFLQELKGMGVTVLDMGSLKRAVKSEAKKNKSDSTEKAEPVTVKSVLPEAPVSDALIIPHGWRLSDKGVFKEKTGNTRNTSDDIQLEEIAPSPVLIQGHLKNITDRTEDIRIIWFDGNKWISHTADRVDIADAKLLVKISDYGCPVTSATATAMVRYLASFEAINKALLPQGIATYQLGWQGEQGKGGFLWGPNLITSGGEVMLNMNIEKMSPDEWPEGMIFFKGRDVGEDQIAKGFHRRGKFDRWLEIVSRVNKYPLVTFSIYSALASPLLMILDEANFVVDWAFPTSRGKTTTLKVAASCWGNPDQRSHTSVVRSWDQTRVYSERALIAQRDLPLILDDTKRASKPEMVSKIIYDISSGQGRGRGSIQGARDTGSWRTIALSNGESKATSFTIADGGTYARVLSIWGSPFGKKDKKKAKMIGEITKLLHKNYGHAGYRFIRYLMKNRKKWKSWRDLYSKLVGFYQDKAGSNEVALRQCSFFAVIHLTAILAKKALGLPIDYKKHLPKVFRKAIAETSGADRAKEALQEVLSWVISNKDSFWTSGGSSTKQPVGGWLGVWNPDSNAPVKTKSSGKKSKSNNWEEVDTYSKLESVALMPNQLHKFLKVEGYEAKAIIRTWKDKGWLDTTGEKKGLTKRVSIDGERPRCYVITREAIKKVED